MLLAHALDDQGNEHWYRNEGFMVELSAGEQAQFYPLVMSGRIPAIDLGGTLGVVAWNIEYAKAHAVTLPAVAAPAPSPTVVQSVDTGLLVDQVIAKLKTLSITSTTKVS